MRAPIIILPLALGSVPSVSTAAPPARNAAVPIVAAARKADAIREIHLLDRLVERERAPLGPPVLAPIPRAPSAPRRGPALDCVHATHDITVDPKTGVTDAKLELRVKAVGAALGAVSFAFDGGLKPGTVTASGGHDATVAQDTFGGSRVVRVDLAPALAAGDETVISMPYSGTLACAPTESSAIVCSKSSDFAYLAQQSIFPLIFDPEAADDFSFDGYTRDIVLRVPAAHDVVATGQKVSESVDGGKKVSRWSIDKPLSRNVGVYAFIGKLGMKEVPGRSVPTTFVFPMPASPIDDSLVSWSTPALDFVEEASGAKLPFDRNLSLVRLPQTIGDPGTATFGMTLLSDSYAKTGDLMYEETWAHENTHLFWGIIVPETDASESRLMTEGMATLTQIEYSHGRHFADEDRDLYLARRFLPMGLDLRVTGKDLPPPVLLPQSSMAESLRTRRYTMWAYYRTAITLDHLRVTVGEELFAEALATYKARCSYIGCRPDVLRTILSETTGKDMTTFFDRWVTGKERPRVRVGFVPTASGVDIALTKDDDRSMTLELWLQLAGGERVKRLVDLGPRVTRTHLDSQASVLSVAASPRHDVLVDVSSAVDGDLDFDGESDGFDVLRCARLTGSTYDAKPASGLWNARETFDARCDVNGDLTIDDRDLDQLAAHFGTLRGR